LRIFALLKGVFISGSALGVAMDLDAADTRAVAEPRDKTPAAVVGFGLVTKVDRPQYGCVFLNGVFITIHVLSTPV